MLRRYLTPITLCFLMLVFVLIGTLLPIGTHAQISQPDRAVTGGTCTNQAVTALSIVGAPTCTTLTSAYTSGGTGSGGFVLASGPTIAAPIFTGTVTHAASSVLSWTGQSQIVSPADGFIKLQKANGSGGVTLQFGTGGGSASTPQITTVEQVNPQFYFRNSSGGGTANVFIEAQKAATGQRFVCIDTAGQLVSSTTACVGT